MESMATSHHITINDTDDQERFQDLKKVIYETGNHELIKVWMEIYRKNESLTQEEIAFIEVDNLSVIIPITIIYSIILVTGIVGNVCTCLVIIRNKYMRTVTNYYLFNLSISDLLLLVLGLPHEIYTTCFPTPYVFGETFCRLKVLASEVSNYVSIVTITAFTVERYVAICHPIKVPTHAGLSRAFRVMVCVWLVCLLCAIPIALQFGIRYGELEGKPIPTQCNTMNEDTAKIIFQVYTFIFFVFPMSVISLLYFFIAVAIRRSTLNRSGSNASTCSSNKTALNANRKLNATTVTATNSTARHNGTTSQAKARQSVLKMLVAVVVAFFLCWAPFHIQRVLVYYRGPPLLDYIIYYLSGVTYYLSATINPVLYSIMSLKFRQAFRSTLVRCYSCMVIRRKPQPRRRPHRNSYTFKFQHRSHISVALHCGAVESSSSTAQNTNNNNNNNNNSYQNNSNSPVICCGDGASSSISRPLVELVSREAGQRPLVELVSREAGQRPLVELVSREAGQRPLVEMVSREAGQRERSFLENKSSSRNNVSERMV